MTPEVARAAGSRASASGKPERHHDNPRHVTQSQQRPPRAASAGEAAREAGAGPGRWQGRGRGAGWGGASAAALEPGAPARAPTLRPAAHALAPAGGAGPGREGARPEAGARGRALGRKWGGAAAGGGAGPGRAAAMGRAGLTAPLPPRHGRWLPHGGVRGLGGVCRQRGARR